MSSQTPITLGVCIGAPAVVLIARRRPLKQILLILVIAKEYEVSLDTISDNIHWVEQTLLNADLLESSVTCVYKTNAGTTAHCGGGCCRESGSRDSRYYHTGAPTVWR